MPFAVVHEVAVLLGLLFVHQAHGGAAPDFPDATTGVAVQHEAGRVKALNRTHVASFGIDRILAIRRERGGRSHGEGEFPVLAVVNKANLRTIVAVGIIAPAGVAIEMPKGTQEQTIRHLGPAFLRQHEEGHDMGAGRIEMTSPVRSQGASPPRPAIVMLGLGGILDAYLNVLKDLGIPGPQIAFSQWNAPIADIPGIPVRFHVPGPLPNHLKILRFSSRKQK